MEIIDKDGNAQRQYTTHDSKRIVAGILAILIGSLGVHKFILGYTKEGIIMIAFGIISFGIGFGVNSLIGLIEGIIYLTKTDEEFVEIYQNNHKGWF